MFVYVTKYIYGQYLYEEADACTTKVEAVACKTLKIFIMVTAAVLVHVSKLVCQIDFYSLLYNHLA